jgi:hypothetical protein
MQIYKYKLILECTHKFSYNYVLSLTYKKSRNVSPKLIFSPKCNNFLIEFYAGVEIKSMYLCRQSVVVVPKNYVYIFVQDIT